MSKYSTVAALITLGLIGSSAPVSHAAKKVKTTAPAPALTVAQQLEARIAATPSFGTLDLTGQTFVIGMETINVENKFCLTIIGGTIIRPKNDPVLVKNNFNHHSCRVLQFKNCNYLVLRNVTVIGPKNPATGYQVKTEGHHAYGFSACSNVLLDHITAKHVCGDGMYLQSIGGAKKNTPCTNFVISGFSLEDSGRHGISLTGVNGVNIKDKTSLLGYQRLAIDREVRVHGDLHLNITVAPDTVRLSAKQLADK